MHAMRMDDVNPMPPPPAPKAPFCTSADISVFLQAYLAIAIRHRATGFEPCRPFRGGTTTLVHHTRGFRHRIQQQPQAVWQRKWQALTIFLGDEGEHAKETERTCEYPGQ